ncbi:NAD(P)/FAD-dependent oxidoreductase [Curtobacterium sp. MCPF17_052]|uniref:NAD(P)/FAD-dependent oxidoreductase n=1 Tax=Curtobacterium sp. MCPF17_052 TaxID=2175655 RepID=UPI003464B975
MVDVVVIGAGPAGLSAALNLVRARRTVLLLDANRPRNAATLRSHGFITRDGISPLELRKLGRDEVAGYPEATVTQAVVDRVWQTDGAWNVHGTWRGAEVAATARAVVIATGLRESFPALPSLRAFYGTDVHSCVECDGYDKAGSPLAFIGETDDVVDRALLVGSWTDDLVVFTNGVAPVSETGRARLVAAGIRIDERPVADLEGGPERHDRGAAGRRGRGTALGRLRPARVARGPGLGRRGPRPRRAGLRAGGPARSVEPPPDCTRSGTSPRPGPSSSSSRPDTVRRPRRPCTVTWSVVSETSGMLYSS